MYIELHSRSTFSFLEGASLPEALIAVCADYGMPAMALLDRNGVYGAPRFHLAAQKFKISAHIGAEVTVDDILFGEAGPARYPLLVESRQGYQNLCKLITRTKLRAKKEESTARIEELSATVIEKSADPNGIWRFMSVNFTSCPHMQSS